MDPKELEELEPTAEKGRAGEGEILPTTYGRKVPSKFGGGEELSLYEKSVPESEEEFRGWEKGYRSWKFGFEGEEPRLESVTSYGGVWKPGEGGEVSSSWKGEELEGHPFSESSRGMYSLRSPEIVKEQGYHKEGVLGSIIPYGEVVHGDKGFRSTKAKVGTFFKESIPCYICGETAKYLVRNSEKFTLCEKHAKTLKKLFKRKGYTELDLEDVLNKLAEIYEAEIE